MGLVVDDTTHLLHRFQELFHETGSHERALEGALRSTGVEAMTTSLVLVVGFAVLGLATVKSVGLFGLLAGVTMVSAMVAELLVLPALLAALRPRF